MDPNHLKVLQDCTDMVLLVIETTPEDVEDLHENVSLKMKALRTFLYQLTGEEGWIIDGKTLNESVVSFCQRINVFVKDNPSLEKEALVSGASIAFYNEVMIPLGSRIGN